MTTLGGCARDADDGARGPTFALTTPPISLPRLRGWLRDETLEKPDLAKGGTVMRLVREASVVGSPRIDVVLEPQGTRATSVEVYLQRNLREMAALEADGKIRIQEVTQHPINIGPRRGFRVGHAYTLGQGASQVAITQSSVFLVIDGRGVTVSAAGRTELYHPLADDLERILGGLEIAAPNGSSTTAPTPGLPLPNVEPVDLGKIGGK